MTRPLLAAPFEPLAEAVGARVRSLLSPWVNPLGDVEVDLGDDDQLD